jgi:hypothetical protein
MGVSAINIANSMGANGCVYVNTTNATTGKFSAVQFTEDSVIGAITGPMENSADLISDGTTFAQGQVIYMPITSLTLVSGACLLINK